ncbi:flavodoxin domain-containing protein [Lacticaseibacillus sp. GG6-2]
MKIKIAYTSLTGNTQEGVDVLTDALEALDATVTTFDAEDGIDIDDFFQDADAYVLASYTDGDGELPDGILDFYDDLEDYDLATKRVAVIGSGDEGYDDFCAAVDILVERVQDDGGTIVGTPIKYILAPDDDAEAEIVELANVLTKQASL